MEKFGVEVFEPMNARDEELSFLNTPCIGEGWVLQRKYDGTRAILHKMGNRIVMPGRSWITDFATLPVYDEIVREARAIPVDCILDAELTFFNAEGRDIAITARVTEREIREAGLTPRLMVFDLISLNGINARKSPLWDRLAVLQHLLGSRSGNQSGSIRMVESHSDFHNFPRIYHEITGCKGEGVVVKPLNSFYYDGDEKIWGKIKDFKFADAVVVGMTAGEGARSDVFGSLILAQRDAAGTLRYVGRVGTGFDGAKLARLYEKIDALPKGRPVPGGEKVKNVLKWVEPVMVAEVKFLTRTPYGILRMPVFIRERDDKTPEMCIMKEGL